MSQPRHNKAKRRLARAKFLAMKALFGVKWPPSRPQLAGRGPRGRKDALLARRRLTACWHDFEYREDWEGDPGVVNGTNTLRWFKCRGCGLELPAGSEDAPSYDDCGPEDVYY